MLEAPKIPAPLRLRIDHDSFFLSNFFLFRLAPSSVLSAIFLFFFPTPGACTTGVTFAWAGGAF